MEIRDSETRKKYLEAKEFVRAYEDAYRNECKIKDIDAYDLYNVRQQLSYLRKRKKSIVTESLISSRLKRIKDILTSRYKNYE